MSPGRDRCDTARRSVIAGGWRGMHSRFAGNSGGVTVSKMDRALIASRWGPGSAMPDLERVIGVRSPRAKGQEFPRVVLYGFGDAAPEGLLGPIQGGESYAEDCDPSLSFEHFMNRLYMAASRPRRRLFVIDHDRSLNQFWSFAREEKTWSAILDKISVPDAWKDNVCLLHPGLAKAWTEGRENPAINAEKYEEEGLRAGDPYWLRAAALQYESAGNTTRQRFCRAMAKFYETKWYEAGIELQECGQFRKAAQAFWNDGSAEALRKLTQLANVFPEIKPELEWQLAEWECGAKPIASTLKMVTKLQEQLRTLSFASTFADDTSLQAIAGRIFESVAHASANVISEDTWNSLSNLMSHLLKTGMKLDFEHQAVIHHRAALHEAAVQAWNKSGKTTGAEYKRSFAVTSPYPGNLQALFDLKEFEEITKNFEAHQGARLGEAHVHCSGRLSLGSRCRFVITQQTRFVSFLSKTPDRRQAKYFICETASGAACRPWLNGWQINWLRSSGSSGATSRISSSRAKWESARPPCIGLRWPSRT
jgi:hypothetical protein